MGGKHEVSEKTRAMHDIGRGRLGACAPRAPWRRPTIEFIQWWEPEMPAGALRGIMDDFEAANPGHQGHAGQRPLFRHATTRSSVGAASGTLSDVVGLDGAWVNGLAKQGAIASMDPLMDAASYRPEPDRRHHQGRRQELHVPAGLVRLSGLREPRPRQGRRRREHADQPHRVRRSREEDDQRRQEPVSAGCCRCRWKRRTASRTT